MPHRTGACAIVLTGIVALAATAVSGEPAAATPTATTTEPATAPTQPAELGEESGGEFAARLGGNFLVLLRKSWPDMLAFVGWTVGGMIGWGIGLGLLGLIVGLALWLVLRGRGLFNGPWPAYRYVRWLWGVLFMLAPGIGGAYAGAYLGLERGLTGAINEDLLLDRAVIHLYQAAALSEADYAVTGQETSEELYAAAGDTRGMAKLARADIRAAENAIIDKQADTWYERAFLRLVVDHALPHAEIQGIDYDTFTKFLFSEMNIEEYRRQYPNAEPVMLVMDKVMVRVRGAACDHVKGITRPKIYLGLGSGFALPLLALLIFRFTVPRQPRHAPTAAVPGAPPQPPSRYE